MLRTRGILSWRGAAAGGYDEQDADNDICVVKAFAWRTYIRSNVVLTILCAPRLFSVGACRTLWGECSECDSSGSAEWTCPLAAEVFNALEGNAPGSRADIVELDGGSGERSISGLPAHDDTIFMMRAVAACV